MTMKTYRSPRPGDGIVQEWSCAPAVLARSPQLGIRLTWEQALGSQHYFDTADDAADAIDARRFDSIFFGAVAPRLQARHLTVCCCRSARLDQTRRPAVLLSRCLPAAGKTPFDRFRRVRENTEGDPRRSGVLYPEAPGVACNRDLHAARTGGCSLRVRACARAPKRCDLVTKSTRKASDDVLGRGVRRGGRRVSLCGRSRCWSTPRAWTWCGGPNLRCRASNLFATSHRSDRRLTAVRTPPAPTSIHRATSLDVRAVHAPAGLADRGANPLAQMLSGVISWTSSRAAARAAREAVVDFLGTAATLTRSRRTGTTAGAHGHA